MSWRLGVSLMFAPVFREPWVGVGSAFWRVGWPVGAEAIKGDMRCSDCAVHPLVIGQRVMGERLGAGNAPVWVPGQWCSHRPVSNRQGPYAKEGRRPSQRLEAGPALATRMGAVARHPRVGLEPWGQRWLVALLRGQSHVRGLEANGNEELQRKRASIAALQRT